MPPPICSLGQLGGGIHDQTFFGATTGRRWKLFRPFVEDDWRVTRILTLNLGFAWALVTPITEAAQPPSQLRLCHRQVLCCWLSPMVALHDLRPV